MTPKAIIKKIGVINIVALVALIALISSCSVKASLTGFEVLDANDSLNEGQNISNESPTALTDSQTDLTENQSVDETSDTNNIISPTANKSISIALGYTAGSAYGDNFGYVPTSGIIGLTVQNSLFSWNVDPTNLCTKWNVHSLEDEKSTTICYGSRNCCNFVDLQPTRDNWNDVFYSAYGQYGATLNNSISSQIIYVDYNLSASHPYSEIYYSDWKELSVNYYVATIDFQNVCVETCSLADFDDTSYNLIFEIDNSVLNLYALAYSLSDAISKVLFDFAVKNSKGIISGEYTIYKDSLPVIVPEYLIEPDYYDIEARPAEKIIDKLLIQNANATKPVSADVVIDKIINDVSINDIEVVKKYKINIEHLGFEKAVLTATAAASSLFECKQWDDEREICFGDWEKILDLAPGEPYKLALTKNTLGFSEGNLNLSSNLTQLNISQNITGLALINKFPNETIFANTNATINLSHYFLNIDNNTIFNYNRQYNNVSIAFNNDSAIIVPDKDFIGTNYLFITANKSNEFAVSNVFSVEVMNRINLNLTSSEPVLIADPALQLKLKQYADSNLKSIFRYTSVNFTSYTVKNNVIVVSMNVDGRNINWLTSMGNFNGIFS